MNKRHLKLVLVCLFVLLIIACILIAQEQNQKKLLSGQARLQAYKSPIDPVPQTEAQAPPSQQSISCGDTEGRIHFFKHRIEHRDGYRIFYDKKGKLIRNREVTDIHKYFDMAWYGTQCDLNWEPNNGRGNLDLAVSIGAFDKTLVEFKLASNRGLERNLKSQVEIYQEANKTKLAFKVIVFFTEYQEKKVKRILKKLGLEDNPHVICIDARSDNKPSASVA